MTSNDLVGLELETSYGTSFAVELLILFQAYEDTPTLVLHLEINVRIFLARDEIFSQIHCCSSEFEVTESESGPARIAFHHSLHSAFASFSVASNASRVST